MHSKTFTAIMFMVVFPCHAEDVFMGAVVSGGQVLGNDTGNYIDITGYGGLSVWLLIGAETKEINTTRINAIYTGLGFTSLIQAHIGTSNQGGIYRIKSEFSPFALYSGGIYPDSRTPKSSLERLTISFTYENTIEDKGLSSFSIGVGYVF